MMTPFDNTKSFTTDSIAKQGSSFGPILNNFLLDDVFARSLCYHYGTLKIKALELVLLLQMLILGHHKQIAVMNLSQTL